MTEEPINLNPEGVAKIAADMAHGMNQTSADFGTYTLQDGEDGPEMAAIIIVRGINNTTDILDAAKAASDKWDEE